MLGKLFGGGSQTVTSEPWKPQQQYLKDGFAHAQGLLGNPTFTPNQQTGYGMATDYADQLGESLYQPAQQTLNFLTNPDLLSPDANPYLKQQADALAGGLNRNLTENLLPSIGQGATAAGQYGSTRQGIAEGIALRGTQEALADQTANLYSNAYSQGLNTMLQGLGQTGNVANLGYMPSQIYQNVGQQQQQQPWQNLQNYMGAVQGNYGGTQTTPGGGSGFGSLLGGAAGLFFGKGNPAAGALGMSMGGLLG